MRPRVAIVGGGVAGLTAALGLQEVCDTVLFEAAPQLGGHILPVDVSDLRGEPAWVDTGFVVFIPETYPRFTALLGRLGVEHARAVTSFRIRHEPRDLDFDAADLLRLCGKQIPKQCRRDLLTLTQTLARIRKDGLDWLPTHTVAEWTAAQGFAPESIELGVLPWVASFWGLQPETVLRVSARAALREIARNAGPLKMHRVLPSTQTYLERIVAAVGPTEVRHEAVRAVTGVHEGAPAVVTANGSERFDRVIVAVGADDAVALLPDAPPPLRALLGRFEYEPTVAVVHTDLRHLPADRAHWRTFHHRRRIDLDGQRSVTTWLMNILHEWEDDPAAIETPVLMSTGDRGLLQHGHIDEAKIHTAFRHRHLVMTPDAIAAMQALPAADEGLPLTLAGSFATVGGLHEDAVGSGIRAADKIRAELSLPEWDFPPASA